MVLGKIPREEDAFGGIFSVVGRGVRGGRWERRLARPAGVRSRILRSPRHSAGTLWHRTDAAPSSPWLTPEAKGAAWLRPWLLRRMPRASKYSSKGTCRARQSPFPAVFHKFHSRLFYVGHGRVVLRRRCMRGVLRELWQSCLM